MNKRIINNKGFTLVELLIVISVISIIAGVLLIQLRPAQILQKSRDSQRLQDLRTLQNAINLALTEGEIALTANGTSCTSCTSTTGTASSDGSGYVKFTIPDGKTGLSNYLATLPVDPTNSGNYVFRFGSTATDFELNAVFEHPDNASLMSTDGGNSNAIYEVGSKLDIL